MGQIQKRRRMSGGIKVKLFISAVFVAAGIITWGLLVSLKRPPVDKALLNRSSDSELAVLVESRSSSSPAPPATGPDVTEVTQSFDAVAVIPTDTKHYVLQVPNCSIPNVPLWNKDVQKDWQGYEAPRCENEGGIVSYIRDHYDGVPSENGHHMTRVLRQELVIENESSYKFCCYREIIRAKTSETDGYLKSETCKPYNSTTKTVVNNLEHLLVECHSNSNPAVQYRFHANLPLKATTRAKIEAWSKVPEKPVSVALLVLDSVSRTHAFRSLNRTLGLLLEELNFVDFKGHHALGEPTMPNAIPMLLGAPSAEQFFAKDKLNWSDQWDKFDFIWKRYSDLGYVTMFAEDDPVMGTFNYGGQRGFSEAPTDYYPRPTFAAHEDGTVASKGKFDSCFGNETVTEFVLNYHARFLQGTKSIPSFSINWLCRPQHDHMEGLKSIDDTLYEFFRKIARNKAIFENTLFILASDHGFWSHPYSHSHSGLLERRLPMLLLRVPESLSKKHPQFMENVKRNSHLITSHHDTHQTLVHLVQMAAGQVKDRKKGLRSGKPVGKYSLLEPIPVGRTCRDAHIPDPMCACNLPVPDESGDGDVPEQVRMPPNMFRAMFD